MSKAPRAIDLPLLKRKCKTCPFRDGSPYEYLRGELAASALTNSSRVCHSTGSNAIHHHTGKPDKLCRGARDVQLRYFHSIGFISEPTDEAWKAKAEELGMCSRKSVTPKTDAKRKTRTRRAP